MALIAVCQTNIIGLVLCGISQLLHLLCAADNFVGGEYLNFSKSCTQLVQLITYVKLGR